MKGPFGEGFDVSCVSFAHTQFLLDYSLPFPCVRIKVTSRRRRWRNQERTGETGNHGPCDVGAPFFIRSSGWDIQWQPRSCLSRVVFPTQESVPGTGRSTAVAIKSGVSMRESPISNLTRILSHHTPYNTRSHRHLTCTICPFVHINNTSLGKQVTLKETQTHKTKWIPHMQQKFPSPSQLSN